MHVPKDKYSDLVAEILMAPYKNLEYNSRGALRSPARIPENMSK